MKKILLTFGLAGALLLAACGQVGLEGQVLTPTARPSATVIAANTPAVKDTPAPAATDMPAATPLPADPSAACPKPGEGQALYVSRDNGYCFLYPAALTAQPDFRRPDQAVDLSGPSITYRQDRVVLHLTVYANGPAAGLDSQAYAHQWLSAYRMDPALPIQALTLHGVPAALIDNLPGGMFSQREAFVSANGFKYQLALSPRPEDEPALADAAGQVWNLMLNSLVLFPPARPLPLAQPDQLCPKAGPDTKLWVDEAQGFCLLYPADFALSADIPGEIIGSAVLSDTHDWGKVYTSLTLGAYDQPPSQIQKPAPPETNVDPSTVVTTTIGGANAVTYDFIGAPWRQHTADILFRVSRYTMVGPWDGQVFPRGAADARRLWDTVTKSIVFFEKWR